MPLRTTDGPISEHDSDVLPRVISLFAVISILNIAAFMYASTVPLVFAVPDYRARLTEFVASFPAESGRTFDWTVNILALIPLAFFSSGVLVNRAATGSSPYRQYCHVASGCLALAVFAETLQLWLPLRVPSLRDLVALECGAILGCALWQILGARTTNLCVTICQRSAGWRGGWPRGLPWLTLVGFLFAGCLAINRWASPSQFFQMYRHRTFSSAAAGVHRDFAVGIALSNSAGTALILSGLCSLGVRALESNRIRSVRRLRVFEPTNVSEPGVSVVNRPLAHDITASATSNRAA